MVWLKAGRFQRPGTQRLYHNVPFFLSSQRRCLMQELYKNYQSKETIHMFHSIMILCYKNIEGCKNDML